MSVASASSPDGELGLETPPARSGASGGIFSYWFGTSSLRADPSDVFAGLVYRLRARGATFAPHELTLLKQCETDVQVRAVTAGYVTGAGTHSALGFISKRAPRLMLSVLAGACGAYAGVQSMARDCMRRIARLEDSQLAADARFVIRQLAPHDPLGREPARGERERTRDGAGTAAATATSEGGGAKWEKEAFFEGARASGKRADVARLETRDDRSRATSFGHDARTNARADAMHETPRATPRATRDERDDDAADGAPPSASSPPFVLRDAFGFGSEVGSSDADDVKRGPRRAYRASPSKRRGGDGGQSRSGFEARATRRRAAVEAARVSRRDRTDAGTDAPRGSYDSHESYESYDGALARDELIDPAPRVSFDRGTRRTSYGDVLDR